jgi:hypothetical protein
MGKKRGREMIVITLKDIIGLIILGIFILIFIISFIKAWLDSIFKKNCYECKHYKFYSTHSCGDSCDYKCYKKDRIDVANYNDTIHYEKCDDFDRKEV